MRSLIRTTRTAHRERIDLFVCLLLVIAAGNGWGSQEATTPAKQLAMDTQIIIRSLAEHAEAQHNAGVRGDNLAQTCFQHAAKTALQIPEAHRVRAYLIAVAVCLDDARTLRKHPVIASGLGEMLDDPTLCRQLQGLKDARMFGRHDWLQHFVVSAGLTALSSPAMAEWLGIQKELADSKGGSGFSFADLQADVAGIAFASRFERDLRLLENEKVFKIPNMLPDPRPLKEGLTWDQFQRQYTDTTSSEFRDELTRLIQRAVDLEARF